MVYRAAFHSPSGESETRVLDLYNSILPFQGPTRALHGRHCPQAPSRIQLRLMRGFCLPAVFIIRFIIIRSFACGVFYGFIYLVRFVSSVSVLLFLWRLLLCCYCICYLFIFIDTVVAIIIIIINLSFLSVL